MFLLAVVGGGKPRSSWILVQKHRCPPVRQVWHGVLSPLLRLGLLLRLVRYDVAFTLKTLTRLQDVPILRYRGLPTAHCPLPTRMEENKTCPDDGPCTSGSEMPSLHSEGQNVLGHPQEMLSQNLCACDILKQLEKRRSMPPEHFAHLHRAGA